MAVIAVPRQHMCPNCFEMLAYTSKDVSKSEKKEPNTYYQDGKSFQQMRTTIYWFVTCPTCGKLFIAEKYDKS